MAKQIYSHVVIIYNPMSTSGKARGKATRLAERLQHDGLKRVSTVATERSGHAEELAYRAASEHPKPLIISVSGDGGYNEVINGVMRAQGEDYRRQPVCAIMAAGGANDHRRSVRRHPLGWAITHIQSENQSLLRFTITKDGTSQTRYAHSYIGFGASSEVANLINQEKYTRWQDVKIAMKTIFFFHPTTIVHDDETVRYDSLVFLLVNHMSGVFRVGTRGELNSTTFRVWAMRHRRRWRQLITIFGILIFGVPDPPEATSFDMHLPQDTLVHLDGEDITIPSGARAKVSVVADAVRTLR